MTGDASLTLEFEPFELKGGRYERITLREPKVIEVRQAESHLRSGVNPETYRRYQIALIAKVADLPEPVVELLPISVVAQAFDYLQGFIDEGKDGGQHQNEA